MPGTGFHDFRHTFASLMLLAGVHPKIVNEMLGRAGVVFTLDTYSHVIGGLRRRSGLTRCCGWSWDVLGMLANR